MYSKSTRNVRSDAPPGPRDWLAPFPKDSSYAIIKELALSHAREGGEQGERIASFIASDDARALCNFHLDYEATTAHAAYNCRQALGFFKKYEPLDNGVDRRAVAIEKFVESETMCLETNSIFRAIACGEFFMLPHVSSVLHRAMRKIALVLGDVPSFEALEYRFGPGATTLTKKRAASVTEKLQAGISCSEDLLPYASRILEEMPHLVTLHANGSRQDADGNTWERVVLSVTNDIVDFVPKDAWTLRTITKGGTLNMMVQLALGDYVSARLAAFGVDLSDQSVNQRLAKVGSVDGSLATLDLSMASDTIATALVFHLLPPGWAFALDACRSSKVELGNQTIEMEKFSSMGNGFTFALESLIFWAIASSCNDDDFASVYGDDIIVPTQSVPLVIECLTAVGFRVNNSKSYWTGPFRESCGADYLSGINIRPYYQKKLLTTAELFKLHNFYVRRNDSRSELVKAHIPEHLRLFGPDGYGDGHLLGVWKPRRHRRCETHGYGGVTFSTYKLTGRRDIRGGRRGDYVLPLYAAYRSGSESALPPESVFSEPLVGFLRRFRIRGLRLASEPIPERVSPVDGSVVKTPSYPGTEGYKKVSIYTFDRG